MKSYRPEVFVQGQWASNALRFATPEEAKASAAEMMGRWMLVRDARASAPCDDPVNRRFIGGCNVLLPEADKVSHALSPQQ